MAVDIQVASVGLDVRRALERKARDLDTLTIDEIERPWAARRRVTLSVEETGSLASILDEAARRLDVYENTDWNLGFGTGRFMALRDDESPLALSERLVPCVTLAGRDGQALWDVHDLTSVTFGQLREAADRGAMKGDPTMIYLHVRLIPAGGGLPWEWPIVLFAAEAAWRFLETAAVANELHDLVNKLRTRLARRDVVERRAEAWIARNGSPSSIEDMFRGEPWSPREAAALLGVTIDEAEGVLAFYGYERDLNSSLWVASEDVSAAFIRIFRYRAWVLDNYGTLHDGSDEPLNSLLHEMLREVAVRGSIDESDNGWLHLRRGP